MFPEAVLDSPRKTVILPPLLFLLPLFFIFSLISAELVLDVHETVVGLGSFGVYELAFLLFRVKETAQVEDDGQKEHEAGHSDDRNRLLSGQGTMEVLAPQSAGHIHRILNVDTQSEILLHACIQLI